MVTKFTKRQLLDQCGFTAEETKIILDYQKILPILVESENDGFNVDARILHEQLHVKKKFSDWIKSNLKDYTETVDYITVPSEVTDEKHNLFEKTCDYFLTLDLAKEISMFTGKNNNASEELKTISRNVRQYFILMEKAVKKNIEWELIRYPLREGYKKMQKALDEYMLRVVQRNADDWDYSIEADALNTIVTGYNSREIRVYVGCKDNITRDSLTATYNEYLLKLQELNIVYLGMNMNRYDRYKMLKQSFDILFPNAIPIRDDVDIKRIIENKNKFLEEVRLKVEKVA